MTFFIFLVIILRLGSSPLFFIHLCIGSFEICHCSWFLYSSEKDMCQGEILNTLPFGGIFYISFISFSFQFSFSFFPTEIETPTFWRLIFSQGLGSVRSAMALGAVAIARLFGRAAKRRGGFHIAYKVYMLILGKTSVTSATCYDSARFQLGLLNGLRLIFHCWVEGERELFLESVWLATTAVRRHIVYQIAYHFLHQQAPNGARFSSNFLQSSSQCPVGPSYTLLRSAQDSLRRWLLCYPQCAPGNWVNFWWVQTSPEVAPIRRFREASYVWILCKSWKSWRSRSPNSLVLQVHSSKVFPNLAILMSCHGEHRLFGKDKAWKIVELPKGFQSSHDVLQVHRSL